MTDRRVIRGRDIRPNAALKRRYGQKLVEIVEAMHHSVAYWLLAEYKRQLPRVENLMANDAGKHHAGRGAERYAEDASPAHDMLAALRAQIRRQRRAVDDKAAAYADWFARRSNTAATAAAKSSISEMFGFTVGMRLTRNVNNVLQSIIAENVSLIRSIPEKYFTEVEGLVMRSVREGRDIAGLTRDLEKRLGIVRRRALDIARDQSNKASASIARARMQDAGITMAVWRHSGRSKHPRPSHLLANGKIFNLNEGLMIEGELTFPGQEINCGCTAAPYSERMAGRSVAALEAWKARGNRL